MVCAKIGHSSLCLQKYKKQLTNEWPKASALVTQLRQVEILTEQKVPRLDTIQNQGATNLSKHRADITEAFDIARPDT